MTILPSRVHQAFQESLPDPPTSDRAWSFEKLTSGGSLARVYRATTAISREREISPLSHASAWVIRDWGVNDSITAKRIDERLCFQSYLYQALASLDAENVTANPIPCPGRWKGNQAWLFEDDTLWSFATWCPGQPVPNESDIPEALWHQAATLLARLHALGRKYPIKHSSVGAIPMPVGFALRLQTLQRWSTDDTKKHWLAEWKRLQRQSPPDVVQHWYQPCQHVFSLTMQFFELHKALLVSRLEVDCARPQRSHWIIGDLWRDNVLVDDGSISGLIDFGAARVDSPVLEIVRWLGSWLRPRDPRINCFLDIYHRELRRWLASPSESLKNSEVFLQPTERQRWWKDDDEKSIISEADFHLWDEASTYAALFFWFDRLLKWQPALTKIEEGHRRVFARMEELLRRAECWHCGTTTISQDVSDSPEKTKK
jgi:hypothetical protein